MSTETKLGIDLLHGCAEDGCGDISWPLFNQLDSGKYDEMSVLNLQPLNDWRPDHKTARKRADRCERRGYMFARVLREEFEADINTVNMSATYRQGRPMSAAYTSYQTLPPLPDYPCHSHAIRYYGVLTSHSELVAYCALHRSGELALVSQILGHSAHLENGVMFLLLQNVLAYEYGLDANGYLVYNRHDSGQWGLRQFKEWFGFEAMGVEWLP